MAGKRLPNRRAEMFAPGLLVLTALLTIVWAGLGHRHGRHWYLFIFRHKPKGIVIHHSASSGYRNGKLLTAEDIDADHGAKGWGIEYKGKVYHIGYHYVVRADGSVEPGRPEEVRGAHAEGYNDHLGICVVGNFSSASNPRGKMKPGRPTEKQLAALRELVQSLAAKYDFEASDMHQHHEFGQTACPGDRFPFDEFVASMEIRSPLAGELSGD